MGNNFIPNDQAIENEKFVENYEFEIKLCSDRSRHVFLFC